MARCRSCDAEILWARAQGSERRIPIDPEPVDGGNVLLDRTAIGPPVATVVGKTTQPNLFGDDTPRYVTHFTTCPNADIHRRSR